MGLLMAFVFLLLLFVESYVCFTSCIGGIFCHRYVDFIMSYMCFGC